MIARINLATILVSCVACAWSAERCAPTHLNMEWSAECFEGTGAERRVKPMHLGNLEVGAQGGVTIVVADPHELVAVDRTGKVSIPGIRHAGDFDYPKPPFGIGRFDVVTADAHGNRITHCGYFQADRLQVVVPAKFDQCQPFTANHALACTDCTSYCTEPDCQDSVFVGGRGILLDLKGKTQKIYALPTLETICKRPELARVSKLDNGSAMLICSKSAEDPFGKP